MKAYKKLTIEVLQLEEDIVRTSGINATDTDKLNGFDDVFQFGA